MFENQNQPGVFPAGTKNQNLEPRIQLSPPILKLRPVLKNFSWLVSTCLELFKQNALKLSLIAVIFSAVAIVISIAALIVLFTYIDIKQINPQNLNLEPLKDKLGILIAIYIAFILIQVIINALGQISLILMIDNFAANPSLKTIIKASFKKILPFFGVQILTGVIIAGPLIIIALILAIAGAINQKLGIAAGLPVLLSYIYLVWMGIKLFPAPFLVLTKNQKITQAINQSLALTRGYFRAIFFRFIGFFILFVLAAIIINLIPLFGTIASILILPILATLFMFLVFENLELIKEPPTP